MEELKNNKMFWVLIVVTIFNIGAFMVGKVVIDRAADRVYDKLRKEYSPSPYSPGFDPDKVNPDAFKSSKSFFELRTKGTTITKEGETKNTQLSEVIKVSDVWRDEWEKERGITGQ